MAGEWHSWRLFGHLPGMKSPSHDSLLTAAVCGTSRVLPVLQIFVTIAKSFMCHCDRQDIAFCIMFSELEKVLHF